MSIDIKRAMEKVNKMIRVRKKEMRELTSCEMMDIDGDFAVSPVLIFMETMGVSLGSCNQ